MLIDKVYSEFVFEHKCERFAFAFRSALRGWLQVCRARMTCGLLLNHRLVSTRLNSMKCIVHWISLIILVRSKDTHLFLKG